MGDVGVGHPAPHCLGRPRCAQCRAIVKHDELFARKCRLWLLCPWGDTRVDVTVDHCQLMPLCVSGDRSHFAAFCISILHKTGGLGSC